MKRHKTEPLYAGQEIAFCDHKGKRHYGIVHRMVGFKEPRSYGVGTFEHCSGAQCVFDLKHAHEWEDLYG